MKFKWIDQEIKYDGTQLRSLYTYLNHGLMGDSIVAFEGACEVSFEHMVDGEDFLAQSKICGDKMLHFIIEEFGANLELAVTRQRLFASLVFESLLQYPQIQKQQIKREGDDIYINDGKLSISIATVTPVSSLIHFALNIINSGTPVKTVALEDFSIISKKFAQNLGEIYSKEVTSIKAACTKVRWVK